MKRGLIFVIISLIIVLGIILSQENIIGQITKSDVNLLADSLMQIDCSGGNPPKECLISISEETACNAEWSKQCHIWADNNGDGIDSCWTLPYTALSTCCPKGEGNTGLGQIYDHSIYDRGSTCCIKELPPSGMKGSGEADDGEMLQLPYNSDLNYNNIPETDCCPFVGPYVKDTNEDGVQDNVCCSDGEGGNEIKSTADGGCSNCCECLTFHEERDNPKVCQIAQATSIKCREKYNFPTCNLYDSNCNKEYKNACEVALDPGQYAGTDDPNGNYQKCIKKNLGGEFQSDYKNDFDNICDNIQVPDKNKCPFYARMGSPGDHACGVDENGNWLILVKVEPSCVCDTDFYRCCKADDTECLSAKTTKC